MWNWQGTFVVDDGWQDFRSETLLVDTIQVLEDAIHLFMSEHLILQAEEILEYTMNEFRSLTFALGKQTSEELSVQFELLQESAEVSNVLQDVQGILFKVTKFHDSNLHLEVGNNCLEFVKSFGFVHEQHFALHEDLNGTTVFQKLCHGTMIGDKPVNDNTKNEAQALKEHFGRKTDLDFKENLVEETIPSDTIEWNHWNGNGNTGMDAVAQAIGIDKTQLSDGHRKRPKKELGRLNLLEPTT